MRPVDSGRFPLAALVCRAADLRVTAPTRALGVLARVARVARERAVDLDAPRAVNERSHSDR